MADWVHCNSCFRQPGDGRKFSLTNCGHIYCEDCVQPGVPAVCKMCKANCNTILLSSKMKPDVELFFTDPVELKKKYHKQILQVMEFQRNHRKRLTAFIQERMLKQSNMMAKAQKSVHVIQEYEREIKLLKEENLYLKKIVEKGTAGPGRTPPPLGGRVTGGSPVNSITIRQRSSPSPTRSDTTSPRSRNKRSPYGSFSQMSKPPYEMPSVTTGRVLVKTPPPHTQSSFYPRTPSPYVGMNAPIPPDIRMPITPLVNTVASYSGTVTSPMETGRGDHLPRASCSSNTYYNSSSIGKQLTPNYPSRLR